MDTRDTIEEHVLQKENRITGREVIVRVDHIRIAIALNEENVQQLFTNGRDFLQDLRAYNALAPWSRPYIVPRDRDSPNYKRRYMRHAANGDLWLGLQFPRCFLPSLRDFRRMPFPPWSELRRLQPNGNHALAILMGNKDKVRWNTYHTRILMVSYMLAEYGLSYRISRWEVAIDSCNRTIGNYIRDHAMMKYLRFERPEAFFHYDPQDGYAVGFSRDGRKQYANRRENARQSLAYDRNWTSRFTRQEGWFDRFEYRLRWPYLKGKLDLESANLIEAMFYLTRPLTEGTRENPRQACIRMKKLDLTELPARVKSAARGIARRPIMYQINQLLRLGVDRATVRRCIEEVPWPLETIWTTDVPNAPLSALDNVLHRGYVDEVLTRRRNQRQPKR